MQLQNFLEIIDATHNLTLATINATANNPTLAAGTPRVGLGSRGPGPGPVGPGGSGGPGGPGGPPPRGPPPNFEAFGCSDEGFKLTGQLMQQGFSTAVPQMGYNEGLFSFVGCRCDAGYDNVYSIDSSGVLLGRHCLLHPFQCMLYHTWSTSGNGCCRDLGREALSVLCATDILPGAVRLSSSASNKSMSSHKVQAEGRFQRHPSLLDDQGIGSWPSTLLSTANANKGHASDETPNVVRRHCLEHVSTCLDTR